MTPEDVWQGKSDEEVLAAAGHLEEHLDAAVSLPAAVVFLIVSRVFDGSILGASASFAVVLAVVAPVFDKNVCKSCKHRFR